MLGRPLRDRTERAVSNFSVYNNLSFGIGFWLRQEWTAFGDKGSRMILDTTCVMQDDPDGEAGKIVAEITAQACARL